MAGPGMLAAESAEPPPRAPVVALALLAAAAFLVLRAPRVLLDGRFWAEEGTVWFAAARGDGLAALLRPHQGYLNLVANVAAGAAALPVVPLESAPRVTVLVALLVQLLPAYLLLTRRASWLPSIPLRVAALGLYLVARPSDEIWLNTANSHFVLGVAAAILLATDRGTERDGSVPAILAFSGLSGVAAALLAPLAWGVAARERTRERLVAALVLTACALLQGALLLSAMASGGRTARADADLFLPALLTRSAIAPFVSDRTASLAGLAVYGTLRRGGSPALPSLAALLAVGALGFACARARARGAALLASASVLLVAAGFFGALGVDRASHLKFVLPGSSERYSYAPNVLLLLALLALAVAPGPPRSLLRATALALVAVAGVHGLRTLADGARRVRPYFDGPSWPAEVTAWRADPSRPVRIWPEPWTIDLSTSPRREAR